MLASTDLGDAADALRPPLLCHVKGSAVPTVPETSGGKVGGGFAAV